MPMWAVFMVLGYVRGQNWGLLAELAVEVLADEVGVAVLQARLEGSSAGEGGLFGSGGSVSEV